MGIGYVYFLRGVIGGHRVVYVGSTKRDLQTRLDEHRAGTSTYTSKMRDKRLVAWLEVDNTHVRSVEFHFKRTRRLKRVVTGREVANGSLENFARWLDARGIVVHDAYPERVREALESVGVFHDA